MMPVTFSASSLPVYYSVDTSRHARAGNLTARRAARRLLNHLVWPGLHAIAVEPCFEIGNLAKEHAWFGELDRT